MTGVSEIRVIGLGGIPLVKRDDDIGKFICDAADEQDTPILAVSYTHLTLPTILLV